MLMHLDEIQSSEKVGNKAGVLAQLRQAGFRVPDGVVLDSDTFDAFLDAAGAATELHTLLRDLNRENAPQTAARIHQLLAASPARRVISAALAGSLDEAGVYAVRSSASKEDLAGHSFAGQYETVLNVSGMDAVTDAVVQCYLSCFSPTALAYLAVRGIDAATLKMPVLIQRMVPAAYSGVAFTVNPTTGDDRSIVIEAVAGLCEQLVSGKAAPEQYLCGWYDGAYAVPSGQRLIPDEMLRTMTQTFLQIQEHFGFPCDIEFAVADDTLLILQTRAVTKIRYTALDDLWTTANFKDGGVAAYVCAPYMWGLYDYVWDYALKKYVLDAKILTPADVDKRVGRMFFGRPYWNLSVAKQAMQHVPGYREREFDAEYGIQAQYAGDGCTTDITPATVLPFLSVVLAQKRIVRAHCGTVAATHAALLDRWQHYRDTLHEPLSDDAFLQKWYVLTHDDYLCSESTYFRQVYINTVHQSLCKARLLRQVNEADYLLLLGGMDDISHLRPFYAMWETTRRIRADAAAFAYWTRTPVAEIHAALHGGQYFLDEVQQFLDSYGYHSAHELDVTYPCYCETPEVVVRLFRDNVLLDDSHGPKADKSRQQAQYDALCRRLHRTLPPLSRARFFRKIRRMRRLLWWREELRDVSTRFYYLIRVYTAQLGDRLAANGTLAQAEDIWLLKPCHLWDWLHGALTAAQLRALVLKNRSYYRSFRNFSNETEIGGTAAPAGAAPVVQGSFAGLGCNDGIVTATARVMHSLSDMERLQPGEILVTKYTDTGWTCKFAVLAGIVTEHGGILCHAAIIAREYDIPCIVCARDAMKKIRDGAVITINGRTGEIFPVGAPERKNG